MLSAGSVLVRRWLPALRKPRKTRASREAAQLVWMYQTYPWFSAYAAFWLGRKWRAVHLASGTPLAPARTAQALHHLILADVQSRPVPAPGRDERGDWTRLDMSPVPADAGALRRGGGRL